MRRMKGWKRILALLLSLALLLVTVPLHIVTVTASTSEFAGGDGTAANPYLIETKEHLNNVRNHLDANFKLVRDIEFTDADFAEDGNFYNNGQGWIPIGDSEDNAFCGVFNGNNFTIDNISNNIVYSTEGVTGSHRVYSTNIGLFGCNQGQIKNLEISNVEINVQLNSIKDNSVDGFVGIICGKNNGTISNCNVSGKINSVENYITEETLDTNVYSYVGGISGENNGIIQNCGSKALVIGCYAGGIVGGRNRVGSILDSCYNLGLVSGSDYASGICGGVNYGEISKCYNSGTIDGSRYVSGISSNNGANIENCFNSGTLHGGSFVGGIVADWNSGNISCCYNVGDIYSTDYFGGIIFPSLNSESGTVSNSYYLDNIPEEVGTGRKEGTRCSYEQMLEKDCFINFDFSTVWEVEIESDYEFPVLKNIRYSNINNSIYESADGTGKWWDPYKIRTKYDLDNIRNDLDAYYKLVGNIVFNKSDFDADGDFYNNGQGWIPIGTDNANSFSGEFDGAGFYIENLQINATLSDSAYIGLFGYSKGVIKNLGVINSNYSINTFEANVYGGAIVGCTESDISNCYTNGEIEVLSTSSEADVIAVGGIAGLASNSKALSFYRCSNECNISIDRSVTSTVSSGGLAQSFAGGIIGQAASIVSISECNNFGDILTSYTGNHLVDISSGGILGYSHGILAKINNCYNCGNVTAFSPDANNLVNNHAGGIAGDNHSIEVEQCYNSGNIRSNHESGGIFASTYAESSITDCFNVGNVSSGFSSGGIGGLTEATILNCYSVGLVEGRIYGGIVGFNNGGNATVTNCFYWDIVDRGVGNWDDNAIKCDLNAMKDLSTYNGFDFENVWSRSSNTNYAFPMLQSVNFVFEKELSIIKIDALPTKLQYLESKDLLDVSGGTIELFYNNGDISLLDMDVTMITGFDNTKVGKQTLTVTYSGKTTTFEVEITKKSLASISISKNPIKSEYLEGDTELDTTGMELILTYNNDSTETITGGWNTEFDFSTHGTKNVKVIYQGKETCFSVTVLEKSISEISIASQPTKQEYVVGEDLQTAGLTIKITYNNGTSATVSTGWSITGYDKNKIGTQTITVTYQSKNATFTVTVKSKVPNSITSSTYIVSGGYISKIPAGTTVSTLINGINEKQYIKVYKGNAEVSGNTKVGTGIIVKLMDGSTVKQSITVVVTGDTNGDGDISITDMIAVKAQILGKSKFEGAVAKAADTNGDNGISITDFIQIKAHILGKSKIQAR